MSCSPLSISRCGRLSFSLRDFEEWQVQTGLPIYGSIFCAEKDYFEEMQKVGPSAIERIANFKHICSTKPNHFSVLIEIIKNSSHFLLVNVHSRSNHMIGASYAALLRSRTLFLSHSNNGETIIRSDIPRFRTHSHQIADWLHPQLCFDQTPAIGLLYCHGLIDS
jgi:hypothetical protein